MKARRALLAAACLSLGSPACSAANPAETRLQSAITDLKAAYYNLLELEKCVDRAPDAKDPAVTRERRRTDDLVQLAQAKELQAYLDEAAAEWRHLDALADKICYFQATDFKEPSAHLLRIANDRFKSAIDRV